MMATFHGTAVLTLNFCTMHGQEEAWITAPVPASQCNRIRWAAQSLKVLLIPLRARFSKMSGHLGDGYGLCQHPAEEATQPSTQSQDAWVPAGLLDSPPLPHLWDQKHAWAGHQFVSWEKQDVCRLYKAWLELFYVFAFSKKKINKSNGLSSRKKSEEETGKKTRSDRSQMCLSTCVLSITT